MHFLYIDPNTGGMLFQLLAVLFAAFSGILLFFSRQIKTGIARLMRFLEKNAPMTIPPITKHEDAAPGHRRLFSTHL